MSEKRGFGDFVDRLTSVAAIVTAVAAVAIAVYEARITREQQKKSVWPYVMQYNSYAGSDYVRYVENVGLGPAIVSSFEIDVGDSVYASWRPLVEGFTNTDTTYFVYSDFGDGSVLKSGERLDLLRIPDSASAAKFDAHRSSLQTTVCYCSLYEECWIDRSGEPRPRAVESCPTPLQ